MKNTESNLASQFIILPIHALLKERSSCIISFRGIALIQIRIDGQINFVYMPCVIY